MNSTLDTTGAVTTDSDLTINHDNGAADAVLTFGNDSDAETLKFSDSTNQFEFSDDVSITGNVIVTGTINGVSAANLASDNTHLKVGTGAGLEVTIAAGDYRINGTLIHYNGSSTVAVLANTTNYLYLTATGVLVTDAGFPTDKSIISLATVTTSGAAVTGIADRRAMSSDDREESRVVAFHPAFDGASYLGDGSDNIGRLYVTDATGVATNFYVWTSTRDTLQDYDVTLRATVPSSFLQWKDPALQVSYTSNTADSAENQLDISVYDTAGNLVTLSGSSLNLAATDWTTTTIEFNAGATWTEEQDFRIVFHMSSKNDNSISLGSVKLWLKTLIEG